MKTDFSETQKTFFTQNGFLEVELAHEPVQDTKERDLWRRDQGLKQFILKTLGKFALSLIGKKQLRLGGDEWITVANRPLRRGSLKERLSIQNAILAASLANDPAPPCKKSALGITPSPSQSDHVLFFRCDLLLDWPNLPCDIFVILFTLPQAVYIHNPNDPHGSFLKSLGLQYGDLLSNRTHPLILPP